MRQKNASVKYPLEAPLALTCLRVQDAHTYHRLLLKKDFDGNFDFSFGQSSFRETAATARNGTSRLVVVKFESVEGNVLSNVLTFVILTKSNAHAFECQVWQPEMIPIWFAKKQKTFLKFSNSKKMSRRKTFRHRGTTLAFSPVAMSHEFGSKRGYFLVGVEVLGQ